MGSPHCASWAQLAALKHENMQTDTDSKPRFNHFVFEVEMDWAFIHRSNGSQFQFQLVVGAPIRQELYKQEGITCDFSDFPDNQAESLRSLFNGSNWSSAHLSVGQQKSHSCLHWTGQGIIDLIQGKGMSIFTLLDEECRMPKAKTPGDPRQSIEIKLKLSLMFCFVSLWSFLFVLTHWALWSSIWRFSERWARAPTKHWKLGDVWLEGPEIGWMIGWMFFPHGLAFVSGRFKWCDCFRIWVSQIADPPRFKSYGNSSTNTRISRSSPQLSPFLLPVFATGKRLFHRMKFTTFWHRYIAKAPQGPQEHVLHGDSLRGACELWWYQLHGPDQL